MMSKWTIFCAKIRVFHPGWTETRAAFLYHINRMWLLKHATVYMEHICFSILNQVRWLIKITEFVCKALQHMESFAFKGEDILNLMILMEILIQLDMPRFCNAIFLCNWTHALNGHQAANDDISRRSSKSVRLWRHCLMAFLWCSIKSLKCFVKAFLILS